MDLLSVQYTIWSVSQSSDSPESKNGSTHFETLLPGTWTCGLGTWTRACQKYFIIPFLSNCLKLMGWVANVVDTLDNLLDGGFLGHHLGSK